jgi:hypothetical protein
MGSLSRSAMLSAGLLLALALPALGQEREVELFRLPPQHEPTTPGTYRDPAADAIDTAYESVGRMATTKIEKFSRWDRAGFTERARKVQYQQQTKLVKGAGELAGNTYFKALGWVNTLADGGATIAGHLAAKDLGGAAVAALDESAQSVAAAGGAWAFGKIGVGLGAMFGGPPGAMIGGAVGGIVGSVVTTVGYNAYASETVSAIGEQAVEPVRPENYYREEARKNRIEWLIANGYPIPAILFEQDWAERDRQFRAADSQPPPEAGPPSVRPFAPQAAMKLCFTEANIPEGWRLSRTRPSLKQFTPTYRPDYNEIFQYFSLYPATVREEVHRDGNSACHYDAAGKLVPSERHRWLTVHIHIGPAEYVIKESGYRVVWRDVLAERVKTDGSWRSDLKLVREVKDAGIEVGYLVQEEYQGRRKNHYQCIFVKGDWRVDISTYGHFNYVEQEQATTLQIVRQVAERIPLARN